MRARIVATFIGAIALAASFALVAEARTSHTTPRCKGHHHVRIIFGQTLPFLLNPSPSLTGKQRLTLDTRIRAGTVWNITGVTVKYTPTNPSGTVDRLDMFLVVNNQRILIQHFQPPSLNPYGPVPNATATYTDPFGAEWTDLIEVEAEIANGNPTSFAPFLGFDYQVQLIGTIDT